MSVAVVTGASSGIGAATARRLAVEGFHVVAAARRADRLAGLVEGITAAGGSAEAVPCDITDDGAVAELGRRAGESVDLLVNNAGGARGMEKVANGSVAD
jgi:NADP-dependent 3-hydroxy acid dehydrogenase YdfG